MVKIENNYQIIDSATSVDLHSMKPVHEARLRIAGSYTEPEMGHMNKTIFNLDNISLLLAGQEPGVDSPYFDYVFHPGVDEIEYVLSSRGLMCYPDGKKYEVRPGHCMFHAADYPHRLHNIGQNETLNLIVVLSEHMSKVSRKCSPEEVRVETEGGHKLVFCPEHPATPDHNLPGDPDGLLVSNIYEGAKTCFAYVTLKPGFSAPECDFMAGKDHNELIYVLGGTGLGVYPDKVYELRQGLIAYNPPGQPVKYINNSNDDLVLAYFCSKAKLSDVEYSIVKASGFEE